MNLLQKQQRIVPSPVKYSNYLNATGFRTIENNILSHRKDSHSVHQLGAGFAQAGLLRERLARSRNAIKQSIRGVNVVLCDKQPDFVQIQFSQRCETGLGHESLRQSSKIFSGRSLELSRIDFSKISSIRLINSSLQFTLQPRKLLATFAHLRKGFLHNRLRGRISAYRHQSVNKGSEIVGNGNIHNSLRAN